MNLKRALSTLIALMLLPVVGMADGHLISPPDTPPITPEEGTAIVAVQKDFLDNNLEDEVVVSLTCTTGTIAPASATLADGEAQLFVISQITDSVENVCTITETVPGDYDAAYVCDPKKGDSQCSTAAGPPPWYFEELSSTNCSYKDIQAGDVGYCVVYNRPTPVDVDVTKVWEFFGAEQADFDPDVRINLFCDAPIVGGTTLGSNKYKKSVWLRDADDAFDDKDGVYVGIGVAKFDVIPDWYPTATDPKLQEYTECWAKENIDDSAVEVVNGCGDTRATAAIEVAAGMGDECTITNTVFFEGIPTLSQYGMAIMALLMLGVGFVGMRRFV
jgi:hypothetical protein